MKSIFNIIRTIPKLSFCTNKLQVATHYTDGAASYAPLSEIKGTKHGGDIYALVFTCTPCGNRMTRTFTKNAYHNGVVLIS
jgi:hypothetical protein